MLWKREGGEGTVIRVIWSSGGGIWQFWLYCVEKKVELKIGAFLIYVINKCVLNTCSTPGTGEIVVTKTNGESCLHREKI